VVAGNDLLVAAVLKVAPGSSTGADSVRTAPLHRLGDSTLWLQVMTC
jgi:hypothetical protein